MAVTLTVDQLRNAIRLGNSVREAEEAIRLLAVATDVVTSFAPEATDNVANEAVIRLAGYLFDMPDSARGVTHSDVLRNSGAQMLLLPYRIHRLGILEPDS